MSDDLDPIGPKGWVVIAAGMLILMLMYGDWSCSPDYGRPYCPGKPGAVCRVYPPRKSKRR
ncbi:hypothetical protein [Haloechinothrix salitolerans]|uniref:Uncharacterized protein n=1 Tax=Haloechinothrix salitolerans TaxID=926830 RepID=A0ABW2C750_9PSEU